MSLYAITNVLQSARDKITKSITCIDHEHHTIHSGLHYYVEGRTTALANAQQVCMKFTTPNVPKYCHMTWHIETNGIISNEMWEDATGGMTGGTTKTPINSYRNSTKSSSAVFVSGCSTSTGVGTKLSDWYVGGSVFKGSVGGADKRGSEVVMKPNTTYLRKFVSGSSGTVIAMRATWYEHKELPGPKVAGAP